MRSTAIFISSAGVEPWESIERIGQRETFVKSIPKEFNIYWFQGNQHKRYRVQSLWNRYFEYSHKLLWKNFPPFSEIHFRILQKRKKPSFFVWLFNFYNQRRAHSKAELCEDSIIKFDTSPKYGISGYKCLLALEYFYKCTDADFMVRTNSTSFFDLTSLKKYLDKLPTKRVYAGVNLELGHIKFKSGACNILSRDVVANILEKKLEWNHEYPEDVALGELIQSNNLAEFYDFETFSISSPDEIDKNFDYFGKGIFHFRCKTGDSSNSIRIMKSLFEIQNTAI